MKNKKYSIWISIEEVILDETGAEEDYEDVGLPYKVMENIPTFEEADKIAKNMSIC